jgi:hypothetical protein
MTSYANIVKQGLLINNKPNINNEKSKNDDTVSNVSDESDVSDAYNEYKNEILNTLKDFQESIREYRLFRRSFNTLHYLMEIQMLCERFDGKQKFFQLNMFNKSCSRKSCEICNPNKRLKGAIDFEEFFSDIIKLLEELQKNVDISFSSHVLEIIYKLESFHPLSFFFFYDRQQKKLNTD